MKKVIALILCLMLALPAFTLAEGAAEEPVIRLDVYSQLANFSGLQLGWGATLLKDLFNVEINIIPEQDGTYATRMEAGSLGDIVVWGSNGEDYKNAVAKGMLLDWEQFDLAKTYAPYITENYTDALESNRVISGDDKIHGFGFNVVSVDPAVCGRGVEPLAVRRKRERGDPAADRENAVAGLSRGAHVNAAVVAAEGVVVVFRDGYRIHPAVGLLAGYLRERPAVVAVEIIAVAAV